MMYECRKHGVQSGDHCPHCAVRAFIPPVQSASSPQIDENFEVWADRMSSSLHTWNRIDLARAAWNAGKNAAEAELESLRSERK